MPGIPFKDSKDARHHWKLFFWIIESAKEYENVEFRQSFQRSFFSGILEILKMSNIPFKMLNMLDII